MSSNPKATRNLKNRFTCHEAAWFAIACITMSDMQFLLHMLCFRVSHRGKMLQSFSTKFTKARPPRHQQDPIGEKTFKPHVLASLFSRVNGSVAWCFRFLANLKCLFCNGGVKIDSYLRPEAFLGDLGLDENLMFLGKVFYCCLITRVVAIVVNMYHQHKPTEDFQLS